MAEFDQGVTPDSPAGTDEQGAASSAETLNTGQSARPVEPTIPYARFHEVNTGYRQAEARAAAAEQAAGLHQQQLQAQAQRVAHLESLLQQRATQPSRSPEQEAERQQAARALRELQSDDPDYKRVLQLSKAGPAIADALVRTQAQLAQLEQRQRQTHVVGEEQRLYQMATAAGMRFIGGRLAQFNDHVASVIARHPQALQAFLGPARRAAACAGAPSHAARATRARLHATKSAPSRLPPPIGAARPAPPAP
jgi:hypothetical protein